MKTKQRDRALEEVRQQIKEANQKIIELQAKLEAVPLHEQKQHPIRFEWIKARSEYWDKIAEMRDIENGKSVIDK
jgi:1,4-alpha-glucan branching enzyme